jgi:hypothetical protein
MEIMRKKAFLTDGGASCVMLQEVEKDKAKEVTVGLAKWGP